MNKKRIIIAIFLVFIILTVFVGLVVSKNIEYRSGKNSMPLFIRRVNEKIGNKVEKIKVRYIENRIYFGVPSNAPYVRYSNPFEKKPINFGIWSYSIAAYYGEEHYIIFTWK